MKRYLIHSTIIHFTVFALLFAFSILRPRTFDIYLGGPGFDFGGGGGGDGQKAKKGVSPKEKLGQPVPQPPQVKVPENAAPVQQATRAEETIKVKDKTIKTKEVTKKENIISPVAPIGDKDQQSQSNIVRKGKGPGDDEFGVAGGSHDGTGLGVHVGVGEGDGSGGGFGFGGYGAILYRRILTEWYQYTPFGSNKSCVIGLTIYKDGQVSDIKLEKSSGDANFDNTAKRAVRNASPLPPLPPEFPKSKQRFRLNFQLLD